MRGSVKWVCLCLLLCQLVGCRGCTQPNKPKETAEEIEAKKKKQRLVGGELKAIPSSADLPGNILKPGHWYQANQKLKANFSDESLTATLSVVNREKQNVNLLQG